MFFEPKGMTRRHFRDVYKRQLQVTDRHQAPGTLRIDATYVYLTEVDHGPSKLLPLRVGNDLVGHEVVVGIYLEVQSVEPRLLRCELVL